MRTELTVNQGIEIQTEQLKKWEFLLKPEVFKYVQEKATENNVNAKTGYDICRGSDIDNIVGNYFYYNNIKTWEVIVTGEELEKDGGNKHNFLYQIIAKTGSEACKIAIDKFNEDWKLSDICFHSVTYKS